MTAKHTVRAIEKNKIVSLSTEQVGNSSSLGQAVLSQLANAAYKNIISNSFDRDDEMEADHVGIGLANKAGYSPRGLSDVLKRLQERNKDQDQPNGLFASHPLIKDRIANISAAITQGNLTAAAMVAPRYAKHETMISPLHGSTGSVRCEEEGRCREGDRERISALCS